MNGLLGISLGYRSLFTDWLLVPVFYGLILVASFSCPTGRWEVGKVPCSMNYATHIGGIDVMWI